ncbi:MAG: arylesterase [Pseudomonadota bacterium]
MRILIAAVIALMVSGARAEPVTIVALGDSLTAGYLLAPDAGFPAQLERALQADGLDVVVNDAGVSGDTTSGGLSRLDWSVGPEADAVIVALGGNDALRGLAPETTRQNLTAILDRLEARGLPVLLAGMLAPVNLGPGYGAEFAGVFEDLSTRDIVYYPFFLEGVAADPSLNLPDGIHPTEEGIAVMVDNIMPDVKALVARVEAQHNGAQE